jgi:hypothetical protein
MVATKAYKISFSRKKNRFNSKCKIFHQSVGQSMPIRAKHTTGVFDLPVYIDKSMY